MSLPWIKIETGLLNKPEVMRLAGLLNLTEHAVVGHLVAFWSWVDANLSRDCPDTTGTKRGLDRVAGVDGFTDAMVHVGWLEFDGEHVSIPNFEYHLSQSAKTRATEARKKQRQRARAGSSGTDVPLPSGQKGGPDKRRGEENNNRDASASCVEPAKQAATPAARKPAWLICEDIAEAYCTFQTNGTVKEWLLPYSKLDEWRRAFPGVNVEQEVNRARQWLIDNRDRRKTCSGMLKFLNTWLTKAQNDGRTAGIRSGGRGQAVGRAEQRERRHAAAFRQVFGDDDTAEESGPGTCQIVQRKIGDGTDTARGAHVDGSIDDLPF